MNVKKTIGLSVLVIGIWGTIGFKILQGLSDETVSELPPVVRAAHIEVDSKDNYPLVLNYNDPFLKRPFRIIKQENSTPLPAKNIKPSVSAPPQIIVEWEKIEFLGIMNNTSRSSTIASIRIDGVDYFGKKGKIVNGFKIENIYKDSIQIAFGTQTKYIKKK